MMTRALIGTLVLFQLPAAAHAESALRAYGKANEAHFRSGRALGPNASPKDIAAARERDFGAARKTFAAEVKAAWANYRQGSRSVLQRMNAALASVLKGGPAAASAVPPAAATLKAPTRATMNANAAPAAGAKGANKVRFGSERSAAPVADGIVQTTGDAPKPTGGPLVNEEGIVQDAGAIGSRPSRSAPTTRNAPGAPPEPQVDDSGIVQQR